MMLVCGTFFDMPYEMVPMPPFSLWLKPFMSDHSNGRSRTFVWWSEFCFIAIHGFKIITGHVKILAYVVVFVIMS